MLRGARLSALRPDLSDTLLNTSLLDAEHRIGSDNEPFG